MVPGLKQMLLLLLSEYFNFLKNSSLFEDLKNFAAVIKFLKGGGFGEGNCRGGNYRNTVLKLYFDIICIIGLFPRKSVLHCNLAFLYTNAITRFHY